MKNFRILFILLITCHFTVFTNSQTTKLAASEAACASTTAPTSIKSIKVTHSTKKPLKVTKQRRLKNYQSNHKINRKRKAITPDNVVATKE